MAISESASYSAEILALNRVISFLNNHRKSRFEIKRLKILLVGKIGLPKRLNFDCMESFEISSAWNSGLKKSTYRLMSA